MLPQKATDVVTWYSYILARSTQGTTWQSCCDSRDTPPEGSAHQRTTRTTITITKRLQGTTLREPFRWRKTTRMATSPPTVPPLLLPASLTRRTADPPLARPVLAEGPPSLRCSHPLPVVHSCLAEAANMGHIGRQALEPALLRYRRRRVRLRPKRICQLQDSRRFILWRRPDLGKREPPYGTVPSYLFHGVGNTSVACFANRGLLRGNIRKAEQQEQT